MRARIGERAILRAALAGTLGAAAWAAAEPAAQRLFATPYSDLRLLGRALTRGPRWRTVGLALHLANGAAFGVAFARLGGSGWRQGLLAAELENAALWPGMVLVDRVHPDRRSGAWPPLAGSGRVFAYEATVHALFGIVLGALVRRPS